MRSRVIQAHDRRDPLRLMCRALAVSPAGYYAWRTRPESHWSVRNRALLSAIRVIHRESRETYGSPSIWDALVKRGHGVGEHRIARLMRVEGIRAKTVKKWRATTQSNHRMPVAENTLERQFTVEQPTRVWAGDLTLRLDHGGLALPRRGARPLLAHRDRLGNGSPTDRGAG
ncbi:MAG TPA: IS3 family transposase [Nitrospiraceae bacterium]|nr:IS3 family transposase [Nitrospiraceae bacterium]